MLEELAYVAQILGVVLVIASLAYVGKQLRQNSDALRAQSRHAVLAAAQHELMITVENPQLSVGIASTDVLSPHENVQISAWLNAIFRAREFSWLQFRHQAIDETQWATELSVVRYFLDSQRVRDWWVKVGRVAYGSEYANFIDSEIESRPATDTVFQITTNWTQ